MKRLIASFIASACVLLAQAEVKLSQQPENIAYTQILVYSGSAVSYICTAQSLQPQSQIAVTTISNANPGSATSTGHGIFYNANGTAKIVAFISGATGMWTPINGTHVLTPTSANAFNLDVDTSTFGAWGAQSVIITTKAPLITKAIWTVQNFVSDSSGNPIFIAYRADATTSSLGTLGSGSTRPNSTCAASAAYQ
jgi:hypothetical protein